MATKGTVYFTDIDARPYEKLELQYFPMVVLQDRSVDTAAVPVVGKSLPSYHQLGGKTEMTMDFTFTAEEESRVDAYRKAKWLESRTYFGFNKSPMHRVQVVFGDMLTTQLWVILSVRHNLTLFQLNRGNMPQEVRLSVNLGLWAEADYLPSDVLGSFRTPVVVNDSPVNTDDIAINVGTAQMNRDVQTGYSSRAVDLSQLQINVDARTRLNESKKLTAVEAASTLFVVGSLGRALIV